MKRDETYKCLICQRWYKPKYADMHVSCCVMHPPGTCCHYGDVEVDMSKPKLMKKFYILYFGRGGGCDYTIGCNMRIDETQAESVKEVENYLKRAWDDYRTGWPTDNYEKIVVVEGTNSVSLDIRAYDSMREERDEIARKGQEEEMEKAEYERLKAKYG